MEDENELANLMEKFHPIAFVSIDGSLWPH
jgi:hypothetical protein